MPGTSRVVGQLLDEPVAVIVATSLAGGDDVGLEDGRGRLTGLVQG